MVTAAWRKSAGTSIRRIQRLYSLNSDPVFAARRDARAANVFRALNNDPSVVVRRERARLTTHQRKMRDDPAYAERKRRRAKDLMTSLNSKSSFRELVSQGLQTYWRKERQRRTTIRALRDSVDAEATIPTGFETGRLVPVSFSNPTSVFLRNDLSDALDKALRKLSTEELTAVHDFLNDDSPNQTVLQSAFGKLRRSRVLQGFID